MIKYKWVIMLIKQIKEIKKIKEINQLWDNKIKEMIKIQDQ